LAHFVGIVRNPYSVVASMMKHVSVRAWTDRWRDFPVPNSFLGITSSNEKKYETMSLAERCTLRWISHFNRLNDIEETLGSRFSIVHYEDLCSNPTGVLDSIGAVLGISGTFDIPPVDTDAVTRGANMSSIEIESIRRLLIQQKIDKRWVEPPWSAELV
jgi:hypothetical protein